MSFRQQKSPQAGQEPSCLGTRWSGEDQSLFHHCTIPDSPILAKSVLATASLSGGSRLALGNTGRLLVGICSSYPCRTVCSENVGRRRRRQSSYSDVGVVTETTSAGCTCGISGATSLVLAFTDLLWRTSTNNPEWRRKSAPVWAMLPLPGGRATKRISSRWSTITPSCCMMGPLLLGGTGCYVNLGHLCCVDCWCQPPSGRFLDAQLISPDCQLM